MNVTTIAQVPIAVIGYVTAVTDPDSDCVNIEVEPYGDFASVCELPDRTEQSVAALAVRTALSVVDTSGLRVGAVWASSTSGSDHYLNVISRLGASRKRSIAASGPVSGANGILAYLATEHAMTGPCLSIFGPFHDHHVWFAHQYLRSSTTDIMLSGYSYSTESQIVAAVSVLAVSE